MKRYFTVAISFTFSVVFSEKKLQIDASVFIFAPKFLTFFELTNEVKSSYSPPSPPPPPLPPPRVRQRLGNLGNGSFIIKFFSFMRAQLIFDSKVVLLSFVLDVLIWTNPPPCPGLKA